MYKTTFKRHSNFVLNYNKTSYLNNFDYTITIYYNQIENRVIRKEEKLEVLEMAKFKLYMHVCKIDNMMDILTKEESGIIEIKYFKDL